MQTLLSLLVMAMQLKVSLLGLPVQYQDFATANMPVVDNIILIIKNDMEKTQTVSNTQTEPTQSIGGTTISTPTIEELTCSLTTSSNVGEAGGKIDITWDSNADSAVLKNNHTSYAISLPTTGTRAIDLSSEAGELNRITIDFNRGSEVKTCEVEVMTQ